MPPRKRKSEPAPRKRRTAEPPPPAPAASGHTPGMAPECLICPLCMLYSTLRSTRPEAMEHLMAAGNEVFLALKAVVDQTADRWEKAQTLQRISVR